VLSWLEFDKLINVAAAVVSVVLDKTKNQEPKNKTQNVDTVQRGQS